MNARHSILVLVNVVALLFGALASRWPPVISLQTDRPLRRPPTRPQVPPDRISSPRGSAPVRWVGSPTLLEGAPLGPCFVSSATPSLNFNADGSGVEYYDVVFQLVGGSGGPRTCTWDITGSWVEIRNGAGSFADAPGTTYLVRVYPKATPYCGGSSRVGKMIIFASGAPDRVVDIGQFANPDTSELGIRRCEHPYPKFKFRTKSAVLGVRG